MATWITESQAAEAVNRSRATLRRWRRQGLVSAHSHGPNRLMYQLEELRACANLQAKRYKERPLPGRPRKDEQWQARKAV